MCDFYANLYIVSLSILVMKIFDKLIHFTAKKINVVYKLPNADIREFYAKSYQSGTWLTDILCPGRKVPWSMTKQDILMKDFKAKARLWMNIIFSRVHHALKLHCHRHMSSDSSLYLI